MLVSRASAGKGTFYLRYKNDVGKTCHTKIGRTTDISLADARAKVKTLRAEIALGADPRADVKARKAVPTYSEFMVEQYLPYIESRKKSSKKDEHIFRIYLKKVFGDVRLNQITRKQIQQLHTGLLDKGLAKASCDHVIKILRHSLTLAVDWTELQTNPALLTAKHRLELCIELLKVLKRQAHDLGIIHRDIKKVICFICKFHLCNSLNFRNPIPYKLTDKMRDLRILVSL